VISSQISLKLVRETDALTYLASIKELERVLRRLPLTRAHTHAQAPNQPKLILSVEIKVRNLSCGMRVLPVHRKKGVNLVSLNPAYLVHQVAKFPFGSQPPLHSVYLSAASNSLST